MGITGLKYHICIDGPRGGEERARALLSTLTGCDVDGYPPLPPSFDVEAIVSSDNHIPLVPLDLTLVQWQQNSLRVVPPAAKVSARTTPDTILSGCRRQPFLIRNVKIAWSIHTRLVLMTAKQSSMLKHGLRQSPSTYYPRKHPARLLLKRPSSLQIPDRRSHALYSPTPT